MAAAIRRGHGLTTTTATNVMHAKIREATPARDSAIQPTDHAAATTATAMPAYLTALCKRLLVRKSHAASNTGNVSVTPPAK